MDFDRTPAGEAILAILDAQVQGSYRYRHDERLLYIGLGPALPDEPITVEDAPTMRVSGSARTLQGLDETMDFAVVFDGTGLRLIDLDFTLQPHAMAQQALDEMPWIERG